MKYVIDIPKEAFPNYSGEIINIISWDPIEILNGEWILFNCISVLSQIILPAFL